MKKFLIPILLILSTVSCFAEQFVLNFTNIQSVEDLKCIEGKYYAMVEVDEVLQPMQLFRVQDDKQYPVYCKNNKIIKEENANEPKKK